MIVADFRVSNIEEYNDISEDGISDVVAFLE